MILRFAAPGLAALDQVAKPVSLLAEANAGLCRRSQMCYNEGEGSPSLPDGEIWWKRGVLI